MLDTNRDSIMITRIFEVPRELVFKALTQPEFVMKWWGPKGFTCPFCTIDLHLGGVFHGCMRSPEGRDYLSKSVFREIVDPERLVFTDSFSDEVGNVVPPAYYGMSTDWPTETLVTMTLADHNGKTKFVLQHEGMKAGKERDMCEAG